MKRGLLIAGGLLAALTLGGSCYVVSQALQEDVTMDRASPLAWFLVDDELRNLELEGCERASFYYTVGDGPKLPGSEVRVRCCASTPEQVEAQLVGWLEARRFELLWQPASKKTEATYQRGEITGWYRAPVELDEGCATASLSLSR